MRINLFSEKPTASFWVDEEAFSGVKKVAAKVVGDYNKVTGAALTPQTVNEGCTGITDKDNDTCVIFATAGKSSILTQLEQDGKIDVSNVIGKNEVFGRFAFSDSGVTYLVIVGSDKRGTIYGMYELSEKMGVSPLHYWADAVIPKKNVLDIEIPSEYVSKEPSVKYRGFFINDEWPCFGNWTMDHFGGFNAKMYDHIFDLLLRLKGNYLWPAMWASSFAWDGPGLESYELADEYGVVIGNSHHEPCLRAGEEYRHVRGPESPYGDAWNFVSNPEGIERFWEDSLDERAHLESVVTIGMRGEADTTILGENSTLKDNIDLLKNVITCQKRLLAKQEERLGRKLPTMLALYKEVEPFFYGDENTEGLCGWEELDDTILMLCEDNHGYLRTLPTEQMKNHPAGYGMYYHVDYHGDPISYEWINSTPLSLIRREMSRAYEGGVRSLWILNVGDLKNNEFPLSFFMNMAYDYEKWGKEDHCEEYTKEFMRAHFGYKLHFEVTDEISEILTETVDMLHLRRPEALNSWIYHPCHYNEAERMLKRAEKLEKKADTVWNVLEGEDRDAYYSLTYFQTKAAVNLIRMHIYGGMDRLFASQGRKKANIMADLISLSIDRDRAIAREFAAFKDGKWKGMELASHVGFTTWNEDGCRYPIRMTVEPMTRPRMFVVREDEEPIYTKKYGKPATIVVDEFMYAGPKPVGIVICNTGIGELKYHITMPDCDYLSVSSLEGCVEGEERVVLTCIEEKLPSQKEVVNIEIRDDDNTLVVVEVHAGKCTEEDGIVSLRKFGFLCLPENAVDLDNQNTRGVWKIKVEEEDDYEVETWLFPMNPPGRDGILRYGVALDGEDAVIENTVPLPYVVGSSRAWGEGVLTHRRVCLMKVHLTPGVHELKIVDEGVGLQVLRVMVKNNRFKPLESYLGPIF